MTPSSLGQAGSPEVAGDTHSEEKDRPPSMAFLSRPRFQPERVLGLPVRTSSPSGGDPVTTHRREPRRDSHIRTQWYRPGSSTVFGKGLVVNVLGSVGWTVCKQVGVALLQQNVIIERGGGPALAHELELASPLV